MGLQPIEKVIGGKGVDVTHWAFVAFVTFVLRGWSPSMTVTGYAMALEACVALIDRKRIMAIV